MDGACVGISGMWTVGGGSHWYLQDLDPSLLVFLGFFYSSKVAMGTQILSCECALTASKHLVWLPEHRGG